MPLSWRYISICFIIQHKRACWKQTALKRKDSATRSWGREGGRLHEVRARVCPPHHHKHSSSSALPPSNAAHSRHVNTQVCYTPPEQMHSLPLDQPHSSVRQPPHQHEAQTDSLGPTGATGTVCCKPTADSHSAEELPSACEDPLFVPGFVISLAGALYSCRALDRVPGKIVLKPLV